MPISVNCPSCSASFNVKDEYAGKRAKCPKCSEPLTIPAAATPIPSAPPVAAPVVARPVVASPVVAARVPAKPTDAGDDSPAKKRRDEDEDEEEKPVAKRRRDEDEEEKPAAKRRRGGDDDEKDDKPKRGRGGDADDDAPKSRRRRRDDDDDEPKKKSPLPLILGIIGGVILVCCGGPTGVYFFWIKPTGEKFVQEVEAEASRRKLAQEQANANQSKPTERPREEPPVADLKVHELVQSLRTDRKKYDKKWIRITGPVTLVNTNTQPGKPEWGYVHVGVLQTGLVVCHFDWGEWAIKPAFSDEQVYSIVGLFDANELGVSMSHCRVDGFAAANPSTFVTLADLVSEPTSYQDKLVDVGGPIRSVAADSGGWKVVLAPAPTGKGVSFFIPAGTKIQAPQPGDQMTVRGVVARDTPTMVDVNFRSLISHFPSNVPAPAPNAALSVEDVLKDAAKFTGQNVAVRGKVKLVLEHVDGDQGTIIFESGGGTHTLHAVFPPGKWRQDFVRGGEDTIDVRGTLSGQLGNPGTGLHYDILNCELTRRVAKDGKEVPLPPVTPAKAAVKVTAEDFAAEFAKDPNTAAKKYTEKSVTVTGVIDRTQATGTRITLKGLAADGAKKAYVIEVGMDFGQRDEAKKYKVGDTVKLTGKYVQFRPASGNTIPNTVVLSGAVIEK